MDPTKPIALLKLASIIMLYINTPPGGIQEKPKNYARERLLHGRPKVFAHRGGGLEGFENSLSAIKQAEAIGVDGVEIDVRSTSEGELVLIHDENLERITGQTDDVKGVTYEEIGNFKDHIVSDYGGLYVNEDQKKEKPALLVDVLEFIRHTNLLVTINIHSDDDSDSIKVLNMLDKNNLLERAFINSTMDSSTIRKTYGQGVNLINSSEDLYAHYVNFLTGGLAQQPFIEDDILNTSFAFETIKNSPYIDIPVSDGLTLRDVLDLAEQRYKSIGIMHEYYQRNKVPVMLYLCNEEKDYNTALTLKANVIVTDKPADLIAYLRLADREHAIIPDFDEQREEELLEILNKRVR